MGQQPRPRMDGRRGLRQVLGGHETQRTYTLQRLTQKNRFSQMNKTKSVLVTGGAGFIGSHIVDRLISSGYSVRVLDDLSTGKLSNIDVHVKSGKIDFVKGNVRDASTVKKVGK